MCAMQIMLNLRLLHAFSHNSAFKDPTRYEGKNSLSHLIHRVCVCVCMRAREGESERDYRKES